MDVHVVGLAGLVSMWGLAGCGFERGASDAATSPTAEVAVDSMDEVDSEVDSEVEAEVEADTGWPEVTFADPLPNAPEFDPLYDDVGDQVVTTLTETYKPRVGFVRVQDASGAFRIPLEEVGRLVPQPGEPHLLRHQLAFDAAHEAPALALSAGALPAGTHSAFYGAVIADPQLVDSDSPAQVAKNAVIKLGDLSLPAYTPEGEWAPVLNDAMIRSLSRFSSPRAFETVMVCGDLVENTQKNELGWLHALLVGGPLTPDSGARDDVVPGPGNDAYDPFVAGGLPADVPWVAAVGNHDLLLNGNFPVGLMSAIFAEPTYVTKLAEVLAPLELTPPGDPLGALHPALFPTFMRAAFRVDPDDFHPLQYPTPDELLALAPGITPPDPGREMLGLCGFIRAHRALPGLPAGHGFTEEDAEDCTGWYAYDIPQKPLRVLALNLGPVEGYAQGILGHPADPSKVGDPRFDQIAFLEAELARAETDGVGLFVISHQRSGDLVTTALLLNIAPFFGDAPELEALLEREIRDPADALDTAAFRKLLAASPNVLAHFAGHTHRHGILAICADGTARSADEGACPRPATGDATGYWEVTTGSGINWPHQSRIIELVQVAGRLGAFYSTTVDARIPRGSLAERGAFVAIAGDQLGVGSWGGGAGRREDRNVLLPVMLPEALATRLGAMELPTTLASETTLLEARPALPPLPVQP